MKYAMFLVGLVLVVAAAGGGQLVGPPLAADIPSEQPVRLGTLCTLHVNNTRPAPRPRGT